MQRTFIAGLLALTALPAAAHHTEGGSSAGGYALSYDAASSTVLPRELAWRFGVERSATRGVLNLVVSREGADGALHPVQARLDVEARDEQGNVRHVPMRRILDEGRVLYVGEFDVRDRERIRFDVAATPDHASTPIRAAFSRDFFVLENGLGPTAQR